VIKGGVSDGTMGQELPSATMPQIFMPSIVTTLILVKYLNIKRDTLQDDWSQATSDTSGNVSVGYGPIIANGHCKRHGEQRDFVGQMEGKWLNV